METKSTPWGMAQTATELAPGIISYSTASHGGIWLDFDRRQALSYSDNWLDTDEWWEEDCDWAVPFLFFAEDIKAAGKADHIEHNLKIAKQLVLRIHPDFAARLALMSA